MKFKFLLVSHRVTDLLAILFFFHFKIQAQAKSSPGKFVGGLVSIRSKQIGQQIAEGLLIIFQNIFWTFYELTYILLLQKVSNKHFENFQAFFYLMVE